jgi:pimeloyl-ACP methyl ester carboxylesterase
LIAPAGTRRYPPNGGGLNGSNRSHSPASFTPRQTQIGAPISLGWTTGNCETSDFAARQQMGNRQFSDAEAIRNDSMINSNQITFANRPKRCVIALHCSLGSGRQWTRLAEELGSNYQVIAPDISGYGDNRGSINLPMTLAEEVVLLGERIGQAEGPFHLVGHSYGGAIAFRIATQSPFASRVRSLTLIEPVLPTLLAESGADRRLHELFAQFARGLYVDLWNGLFMEAIDKFISFWNGSGPPERLSSEARLRMIEHAEKLAFDFTAVLAEENVTAAAAAIRVPTLLFSGGLSPYLTQRIVWRLASAIVGANSRHLPAAGHMLPVSHAKLINPEIVRHIARADDLAEVSMASGLEATARDRTPGLVVSCPPPKYAS